MSTVLLDGLTMKLESLSYNDALHAVVAHQGWLDVSKPMLSGMTVTGFRFSVDHRLTSDSPTAYNWVAEHFLAADFIGLTSFQATGFTVQPTFPLYRKQAIADMKASIDRGVGAIFWHGDFVVAAGYNDEREVLYVTDGRKDGYDALPYDQFGLNDTPYWHYQILGGRMDMDPLAIYKESFLQAMYKWEARELMLPAGRYFCGKAAYEAIIAALRNGDYDRDGARQTFLKYAASKRDIAAYVARVREQWPEIGEVAELYGNIASLFRQIAEEAHDDNALIALFEEAQKNEQSAMHMFGTLFRETAGIRSPDIGLR